MECLINQLIFTLKTGKIREDQLYLGLTAAISQGIPSLKRKLRNALRGCFSKLINTKEAMDFSKNFPEEYDEIAWSAVLDRPGNVGSVCVRVAY